MVETGAPESAMYRTIRAQPDIVRAVLASAGEPVGRAAALLSRAGRIFLAGTGTSSHAAIVGEHLLRAAGADATATTLFDFVTYPRPLRPTDALIVISHRGSKRYGTAAIARATAAGIPLIGVSGQDSPMVGPAVVLATAPQEESSTHTASYTGNLAALALLAVAVGEGRGADMREMRAAVAGLPAALEAVLASEAVVRPVAQALAARGRLVLFGAGPNAATAREGALKVKESSYLVAEGFELETALHGALPAVEPGDIAVVIAAAGAALERTGDLLRALDLIGARLLVVADERVAGSLPRPDGDAPAPTVVPYPAVPEALSPLLAVVSLQLLAAWTAAFRGTDADSFRADDARHKAATDSYVL